LMTDPCIFALRRLVANFEARTCWREQLRWSLYLHGASTPKAATPGMTFRNSALQGPLTLPRPPHSRRSHANDYCDEQVTPLVLYPDRRSPHGTCRTLLTRPPE
jgi:hypothetical protein